MISFVRAPSSLQRWTGRRRCEARDAAISIGWSWTQVFKKLRCKLFGGEARAEDSGMRRVMFGPLRILTVNVSSFFMSRYTPLCLSFLHLVLPVRRMTRPTTLVPPHRANYRQAGSRSLLPLVTYSIGPGRLATLSYPSPSRTRASVLILYLGVSCSRPGLNRSAVDRPRSGSGATHVLLPLQTSESEKAMTDSTSSSRPRGNRVDSALLLPDSDMAHFFHFLLPPVGMTNTRV